MRPFRIPALALCLALPLAAAAQPAPPPAPAISFDAGGVTATGVTPKGRVVWFSVAREFFRHSLTIVPRQEIVTDDDGDGAVRFQLEGEVPEQSYWFAVDLESGAYALAAPAGYEVRRADLPERALPAELNHLELDRAFVYAVLVRPKVGAWRLRAGDGGESDQDGEPDGTLRAALQSLESLGASPPPPEKLAPGDLLLVIDPNEMQILTAELGKREPS